MTTRAIENPSMIKNKIKRAQVNARRREIKAEAKRKLRMERKKEEDEHPELKEERLKKNVPKTLDNTREADETMVTLDDEEVLQDEQCDEFASYFEQNAAPKVLITANIGASKHAYAFARELQTIFPNADVVRRTSQFEVHHVVDIANKRGYTDIIVINENQNIPNALAFIHLPEGPTAYFKLSSIVHSKDIRNRGRVSAHDPELILNNFNTRLGHTIGRFFASLFPHVPEFKGRQACTFHNQRDFIFFRRHRYMFKDGERVDLQEIGPRFTLKLKWLQKGTFDVRNGDYEWIRKPELETSRRRFFL